MTPAPLFHINATTPKRLTASCVSLLITGGFYKALLDGWIPALGHTKRRAELHAALITRA